MRETDNRINRMKINANKNTKITTNATAKSGNMQTTAEEDAIELSMKELRQRGMTKYDAEMIIAQQVPKFQEKPPKAKVVTTRNSLPPSPSNSMANSGTVTRSKLNELKDAQLLQAPNPRNLRRNLARNCSSSSTITTTSHSHCDDPKYYGNNLTFVNTVGRRWR